MRRTSPDTSERTSEFPANAVIGLDATYSFGRNLSGVGIYSRELIFGLARRHPHNQFALYYRPHRFWKSFREPKPVNARRRWLGGGGNPWLPGSPRVDLFHALNQRVDRPARRTVSTFHDLFVMTGEYSSPEFRARFTEQARRAAERSDAIIAVSAFTAAQVEQLLGVERARIHVVHHGIVQHGIVKHGGTTGAAAQPSQIGISGEASRLSAAGGAHGGQPVEPARENIVLFVGAIQKRKNTARLVHAFEKMPAGWRLKLAGAADGYGAAGELTAVENSPRRGDIDVLGYVSAAQLADLYKRARIFAFPSLDEGFGMPILEAMANGVPVVTSSISALPEVSGDAALLVDPQNTDELAAAMIRLALEEDLHSELTRRGLERAASFTWELAVDRTWQVYQSLF